MEKSAEKKENLDGSKIVESILLWKIESLKEEMHKSNYTPVVIEVSREGSERQKMNQTESLMLAYLRLYLTAKKVPGVISDDNGDDDGLMELISEFKD